MGLPPQPEENFTTTDFWRFWVVHQWVEDFLEVFTTIEDWPHSDITRFSRVLALMLVVLATFIGSVGLVRNHEPAGLVALGGGLVLAASVGQRMVRTVLDHR
jgi:hypothetical protein